MTQAEINSLLDAMQAQFDQTGDEADRPGVITFQTDAWIGKNLPTCCTAIWRGIRYRGVRILVSKDRETRVWTRGEAAAGGQDGGPYEDLKSIADAAV
ncbi:hypothetical protein [Caulobacter sp.]|uniref:hypothetical protein n=1 Tax=Caulobacter sp. TaxID=78 RepID=UPI0031D21DB3